MNWLSILFFTGGCFFLLLAAVGSFKFPDLFMRMAAVSKASTLGVILFALGNSSYFNDSAVWLKATMLVAFMFLSAPVAAHLLGRAAYRNGTPLYSRTKVDKDANQI